MMMILTIFMMFMLRSGWCWNCWGPLLKMMMVVVVSVITIMMMILTIFMLLMLRSWWCWYVESHVDDGGGGSHNDDDFDDAHDVFVHCDVHGDDIMVTIILVKLILMMIMIMVVVVVAMMTTMMILTIFWMFKLRSLWWRYCWGWLGKDDDDYNNDDNDGGGGGDASVTTMMFTAINKCNWLQLEIVRRRFMVECKLKTS